MRRTTILFVLAVLLAAAHATAADEPQLYVLDAMKFPLGSQPPSFLVFAKNGPVQDLTVKVLEIKHGNAAPAASSLDPAVPVKTVPLEGVRVTLTPVGGALAESGDYMATLDISGTAAGKPVALKTVATLTRSKPVITASDLENKVVPFTRGGPFKQKVDVVNPGSPLTGITVAGGGVTAPGTNLVGSGNVTVDDLSKRELPAGRTSLTLTFADFDAGEYQTRLIFTLPSPEPAIEIPFRVRVTDCWLWPLLTIAAGVGLALFVNIITNKLKPRQETIAAVMTVADTIYQLRGLTGDADRVGEINNLADRLRLAEQRAKAGNLTEANSSLKEIDEAAEALRRAVAEEGRAALVKREEIAPAVESLRATGATADGDRLAAALDRVDQRIAARQYKSAAAELAALQSIVDEVKAKPASKQFGRETEAAQTAPEPRLMIETDPVDTWLTGRELTFAIPAGVDVTNATIVWNFGDGEERTDGAKTLKAYQLAGNYSVSASVRAGGVETAKLFRTVVIGDPPAARSAVAAAQRAWAYDVVLSLIGLVVAVATGMWLLYADKAFGTFPQYLEAFLWGFGIDNSVRGLSAVMTKIKG